MLRFGKDSEAFGNLLELARSFDDIPQRPAARNELVRLAQRSGATAVPLLARKLRGAADPQASWAAYLLARVGGDRAAAALRELLADASVAADRRRLALALLAEIGVPVPGPGSPTRQLDADPLRLDAAL